MPLFALRTNKPGSMSVSVSPAKLVAGNKRPAAAIGDAQPTKPSGGMIVTSRVIGHRHRAEDFDLLHPQTQGAESRAALATQRQIPIAMPLSGPKKFRETEQ